jgi:hypothetical protein
VIKSRRRRWAGHVARVGEEEINGFCKKKPKIRGYLKDVNVDDRIKLKRI